VNIHRIRGIAFSSYLIETPDSLFLVDSGFRWFEPLILRKIRSIGRVASDLKLVLLTHPHLDHVGGVPGLARKARFHVAAHPLARNVLEGGGKAFSPSAGGWTRAVELLATTALPHLSLPAIRTTLPLEDGVRLDEVGLPATVLHTRGHSDWCVSLVLDDGTAFCGDLLIGVGHMTTRVSPPAMAVDARAALDSIRKVLAAGAQRFLPAHGREFTAGDVARTMRALGEAV
jgi:glyoxylase-like metal-dependent hydrolase (beta-lactamase superfamily II)